MGCAARVQHVTRASSDELLRKFAELESESAPPSRKELQRASKRRKKSQLTALMSECRSPSSSSLNSSSSRWMERRSLLLPPPPSTQLPPPLGFLRQLHRARDFKNRSLLGTLGKTWRKTVQGASRVFTEKQQQQHYNRHKRLISDAL